MRVTTTETTTTIEIDDAPRAPTRRHVHIPATDSLVRTWFDVQKDQSASVRMLIHEDIRRHGLGDRVHRAKFGSAPVVPVMSTGSVPRPTTTGGATAPAPAAAPTPSSTPSAAGHTAPAAATAAPAAPMPAPSWAVPMSDPRDAEIARLQAELERMKSSIGAFTPFFDDLAKGDVLL